jgi:type I restriction enzyme S subunit
MDKLGKYCKIISGYAFKSNDLSEGTDIPVIKIGNISNGNDVIIDNSIQYVSKDFLSIDKKYHIVKGDVLISLTGSHINQPNSMVGRSCRNFSDTEFLLNQRAGKVIPNDNADKDYLYYLLNTESFKYSICNRAYGAANQANISPSDIEGIKWDFPSLPTQQKIASILSAYDNLIENNNKRIKILEQMAENLYKEWFVRFRFPGHETTPLENGIPKGWKKGELADVCCFLRGKNITSSEMIDGPYPVIAAGLVPSGYHSVANVKGTSVTISNSGANAGYISIHYSDIWAADCSYVSENDTKNIFFVYEMLRNLSSVITNMQRGAAQPHVYAKDVNQLKMYLPDEKLMSKANIQFKAFHQQIFVLTKQNEFLIKQRDLLLPRLMSGKLAV